MTAFSIALVLSYFYPALEGTLFFLAISIGFSRIVLGMHFLSDVLAGVVLGVALGCAIHHHFCVPRLDLSSLLNLKNR